MNRHLRVLTSVCMLLFVPPVSIIMACPQECGPCQYWDGEDCRSWCTGCCACDWWGECGDFDLYCELDEYCSGCGCVPPCTVSSVTASKSWCWKGQQITFTASGSGFTTGQPTWTASVGSFPGGNTGTSVTWQAPSDTGGHATITASCRSSSKSRSVGYADIGFGNPPMSNLMRSASVGVDAIVTPEDAPITLSRDNSTSPFLGVDTQTFPFFVTINNLIDQSDLQAHVDSALAAVDALLPGCDMKVFSWSFNLKKSFANWCEHVDIQPGEALYNALKSSAVSIAGDYAKQAALSDGWNSGYADLVKSQVRTGVSDLFEAFDPFSDRTTVDSVIPESRIHGWSGSISVSTGVGTFTINQVGYPGWPEVDPPSIGQLMSHIMQNGITFSLLEATGVGGTLTLAAPGGSSNGTFSVTGGFGDPYGRYGVGIFLTYQLNFGPSN